MKILLIEQASLGSMSEVEAARTKTMTVQFNVTKSSTSAITRWDEKQVSRLISTKKNYPIIISALRLLPSQP